MSAPGTNRFSAGVGTWRGTAEVYGPDGAYLGPGHDARTVRTVAEGVIEVDVSFTGPFSFAGTYRIADEPGGRAYEGPLNHGFAEAIGTHLVDAHSHWPGLGLSQRLALAVDPSGDRQLSLALLSRGELLRYVVIGENVRVVDDAPTGSPAADLPRSAAGLLHRPGRWHGRLAVVARDLQPDGHADVIEHIAEHIGAAGPAVAVRTEGLRLPDGAIDPFVTVLSTDAGSTWTTDGEVVGSTSVWGGRAQAGTFVHTARRLRATVREVVSRDGERKAVVQHWWRGGQRVGIVHGYLAFEREAPTS